MHSEAKPTRDPYGFSLRGMAAINPYVIMPAVDSNGINRAWDARLSEGQQPEVREDRVGWTRRIEDLLARYFAPGCCDAA